LDWKDHTHQVGCIVTNLQALETVLRRYLMAVHGQQMQFPNVGDLETDETYLTNFLSLEALVRKFNDSLTEVERKFAVDRAVVDLRDAFAHGRLLTENEFPARLWKFGLARDARVPVEFCAELTVEWLKEKSNWIDRQRQSVVDCFKARGYRGLR
jgi:hypothetical protein